jgi:hypothetical protein
MKGFQLILFTLLLGYLNPVWAQNETVVLNLSATEFNGKVLLTWSVTQGNTCNGIEVLRSLDGINYAQIGSIEGICGSTTATVKYQFTDPNPIVNATNYYRLSLGGIGFSYSVNTEVIDTGEENYVLAPHPLVDESLLIFDNENQELITITFFTERGEIVTVLQTSEQSVSLNRSDFSSGIYPFILKSNGKQAAFSGMLVVL